MFGIFGKIAKGITVVNRVKKAVDEGKDVAKAIKTIEAKYDDLDDDLKAAWKEVKEFADAVADIV